MRANEMRSRYLIALLLLGTASCDDFGSNPRLTVETVQLSAASLVLAPGEAGTLAATAKAANGDVLPGRSVSWGTSDHLVATVSNGQVTAVGFGVATIVATSEGKSAQATATVTAKTPAHLAASWRMQSFDGIALPGTYAFFPDEPVDGTVKDVEIRLDSAKMQMRDDGVYPFRQYCFTELHDEVPRFRYCWGDHGRFSLAEPGRVSLVSEYIQNLSAAGTVTASGGLALTEPLWVGESPRATVWRRSP